MKWIFIGIILCAFTVKAEQQYTESTCILLKQQVLDYQRRLGKNSSLYAKSKANFDVHCQKPITNNQDSKPIFANKLEKQLNAKVTIEVNSLQERPAAAALSSVNTLEKSIFGQFNNTLVLMLVLLFLGVILLHYLKIKLPEIKGRAGERYVRKALKNNLDESIYTVINDVTLPLESGGSTQIDHLVFSTFGVFVIETKNMSGWIFGNEQQPQWTQTIYRSKHTFQNPLRQNYKHTKTLAHLLDLPHELFHSVIIFTTNAELKNKMPDNVGHLNEMMFYIQSFQEEILTHKLQLRVLKILDIIRLKPGRNTNKQHVEYLKNKHKGNIVS